MAVGAEEKMVGLQNDPGPPRQTARAAPVRCTTLIIVGHRLKARLRAVSSCTNSSRSLLGNFGWR